MANKGSKTTATTHQKSFFRMFGAIISKANQFNTMRKIQSWVHSEHPRDFINSTAITINAIATTGSLVSSVNGWVTLNFWQKILCVFVSLVFFLQYLTEIFDIWAKYIDRPKRGRLEKIKFWRGIVVAICVLSLCNTLNTIGGTVSAFQFLNPDVIDETPTITIHTPQVEKTQTPTPDLIDIQHTLCDSVYKGLCKVSSLHPDLCKEVRHFCNIHIASKKKRERFDIRPFPVYSVMMGDFMDSSDFNLTHSEDYVIDLESNHKTTLTSNTMHSINANDVTMSSRNIPTNTQTWPIVVWVILTVLLLAKSIVKHIFNIEKRREAKMNS